MANCESKQLIEEEVTIPFSVIKSAEDNNDVNLVIESSEQLYWEDDEYFFEMCKAAFQFALRQAFKEDTGIFLKEANVVSEDALGCINSSTFYVSEGGYYVCHNKAFFRLAKRLDSELRMATDMILSGARRRFLYFEMIFGRWHAAIKRRNDIQQLLSRRKEKRIPVNAIGVDSPDSPLLPSYEDVN